MIRFRNYVSQATIAETSVMVVPRKNDVVVVKGHRCMVMSVTYTYSTHPMGEDQVVVDVDLGNPL